MRLILLTFDFFIITFSWLFSSYLIAGHFFTHDLPLLLGTIAILYVFKVIFFVRLGLYNAILRYAGFPFARAILKAVSFGSFSAYLVVISYSQHRPAGIFIMDWLLTFFLVSGTRFLPRYYSQISNQAVGDKKRTLIYGAGDLGEAVARSLFTQQEYQLIGFIDDDEKKIGKKLHNLPIFGKRADLSQVIRKNKINELVIAITNVPSDWLREIIKTCRTEHVFCRIAPKISDMLSHEVNIKNIDIVDLLKRDPEDLDENQIIRFLKGKKILISGAAGSIGSELVRQALCFHPQELILVDISEFGLYSLQEELATDKTCPFSFVLLNLCNAQAVEALLRKEKPDIIIHAAAYKHVPLMEENPATGVCNNIQSTLNLARAADQSGVGKFVLISTDKAVRPTNVMGATKRICELYIQNLSLRSSTEYVAVRFGNVLGSSGSVIPKFLTQIKNGGPITVTHPEVTRYFMLIQEAAQLTLQAAAIGHGGEIFILNMGKPVKIKEMAENLIFLAGKTPYKDIDITFTGLRAGEKLYEELLIDEGEKKTQYANITIAHMTVIEWNHLNEKIQDLLEAAQVRNRDQLLITIKELVPEFNHHDLHQAQISDKVVPLPTALSQSLF